MLKYRKIFIIIAFILIALVLGFIIFYIFFYTQPSSPPPSEEAPAETGILPYAEPGELLPTGEERAPEIKEEPEYYKKASPIAKGSITQTTPLYENPIYKSTIAPNGKDIITYDKIQGKFIKISPDGKLNYMTDKVFHNVEKITWAPNKMEAVLEYPDGANIIYNFKTQKQTTLPKHWEDFSYSPASNQIVAKSLSSNIENNWLIISNPDGTTIKTVEHLGSNEAKVYNSWSPHDKIIAMYAESKDFDRQQLFFIGQNQENFPLTIIEGRGFEGAWSKTGNKLLYSVYNSAANFKPMLWTVTTDSENMSQYRKKININTWASKCYFYDNNNIYCAVPESLPEGSGIYPEVADDIADNIYKINIETGAKKFIARPADDATIENLIISEDEKYLYYTDKNTGVLKKILLK